MNTIGRDSARAEAQETFVGLLATPLLTARTNAALFAGILRHRVTVGDWVARLGYRLVLAGTVARLHRDPAGPQLTAAPPPWDPPARRDLVLLALTAAAFLAGRAGCGHDRRDYGDPRGRNAAATAR